MVKSSPFAIGLTVISKLTRQTSCLRPAPRRTSEESEWKKLKRLLITLFKNKLRHWPSLQCHTASHSSVLQPAHILPILASQGRPEADAIRVFFFHSVPFTPSRAIRHLPLFSYARSVRRQQMAHIPSRTAAIRPALGSKKMSLEKFMQLKIRLDTRLLSTVTMQSIRLLTTGSTTLAHP